MSKTYNENAVQQILRLAMVKQGQDVALLRSQLVEIAEDLGISESTLVAAEEEWQTQQEEEQARESFDAYRHQQLRQSIVRFLAVNGGLVFLNLVFAHRIDWSVYPVLIWGMVVTLQTWQTFRTEGEQYDRAFRRWRLRQQIGQSFKEISERFKFLGFDDVSQKPSAFNPNNSAAPDSSSKATIRTAQAVSTANGSRNSKNSSSSDEMKSAVASDSNELLSSSTSKPSFASSQSKEPIAKDPTEDSTESVSTETSATDSTSPHPSASGPAPNAAIVPPFPKVSQSPPTESDLPTSVESDHDPDRHS